MRFLASMSASFAFLLLLASLPGCERDTESGPPQRPLKSSAESMEATQIESPTRKSEEKDVGLGQYFRDYTDQSQIRFQYRNARQAGEYVILESLGGGVGVFDMNSDGLVDLCFAGGGELTDRVITGAPCGCFLNIGGFRFQQITDQTGLAADRYFNHGIFPADFDSDGFPDLAVTGYGGLQLFRNQGDGRFQPFELDQAESNITWSSSAAWGDYDHDGHLDLYVAQYVTWSWEENPICFDSTGKKREVCAPGDFSGLDDVILFNDGAGGFYRRADGAGLVSGGKGLGVISADLDQDGDTDIYVANDTTDNFLYFNDGNGFFEERAIISGVSGDDVGVNTGSMGVAVGDSNQDGLMDLWVTNFERELFALYRNEGAGLFTHVSRPAGLLDLGGLFVGFGTVFIDFDQDLDQDLVVANGHVSYHSSYATYRQSPLLLENLGAGRFRRIDERGYFGQQHVGRGLAKADLDNDGSWDLIFCNSEERAGLLKGQIAPAKDWILVQLIGREVNRDAIGTIVEVQSESNHQVYSRSGGGSYLSQNDARIRIAVPQTSENNFATVRWQSGREETFEIHGHPRHQQWIEGSGKRSR